MKSKSRRELIDELKEHKKASETYVYTIESQRGTIAAQHAQITVKDRQIAGLKESLAMLSDDKDVRYTKAPDRGTVETYTTIVPEHIKRTDVFNSYNVTYAREILCKQIAKALVDNGLVRFETKPLDMFQEVIQVTARVDVIPWYALCERVVINRDKSEVTIEGGARKWRVKRKRCKLSIHACVRRQV